MAAWNKEKAIAVKAGFFDFLSHLLIDSKDSGGRTHLEPYGAQVRFFDGIFDGLENDIHHFVVLKARQLGITTGGLALDLFWVGVFEGLQGAIVFDSASNMAKGRQLLLRYIEGLPKHLKFPRIKTENRNGLWLDNGSSLDYLVAGVRKSAGSGGLGRSRALNFVHGTECSSWADEEGLMSLERSLSEKFPDRLYIWESTARGFNTFYKMWEKAKADDLVRRSIFIGWWAKEDYSVPRESAIFDRYGKLPPTIDEQERIDLVLKDYGFQISQEQLAWWRHEEDPSAKPDESHDSVGSDILMQELPWHETDAFLMSGNSFFSGVMLSEAAKRARFHAYKGFRYHMGEDFLGTSIEQVRTARETQLKVWEEPDPRGVYVVGADPAFGSSESADRYCIQVLRCYADGLDQVAEFCTTILTTYQFAWVCAHLCGAYGGQTGSARLILEINGPGEAVLNEFRTLQLIVNTGYLRSDAERKGLRNMFDNVRAYFYQRPDSLSRGGNLLHFKMNLTNKISVMNRLRDGFQSGALKVFSLEALEEMSNIIQSGDVIKGEGNSKDDRAIAMALGVRAWNDSERSRMIALHRTRENEKKAGTLTTDDMQTLFNRGMVEDFFKRKETERKQVARAARRSRWNW